MVSVILVLVLLIAFSSGYRSDFSASLKVNNFKFDTELWILLYFVTGFCCIPLKSIDFFFLSGIQLRCLRIILIFLKLDSKLSWVDTEEALFWINLVPSLSQGLLKTSQCILGSLYFGWWEHKLLPALCDHKLFWPLFSQPQGGFSIVCRKVLSQKLKRTPLQTFFFMKHCPFQYVAL